MSLELKSKTFRLPENLITSLITYCGKNSLIIERIAAKAIAEYLEKNDPEHLEKNDK